MLKTFFSFVSKMCDTPYLFLYRFVLVLLLMLHNPISKNLSLSKYQVSNFMFIFLFIIVIKKYKCLKISNLLNPEATCLLLLLVDYISIEKLPYVLIFC